MSLSKWEFFGKGLVTKDKSKSGFMVEVIPFEHLSNVDGEVIEGYDGSNNFVKAMWMNLEGGSRMTAPNVMKGEKVHIYKYGELENGYYWTTEGSTDFKLRKLEHIEHRWSDQKDQGEATKDKCYTFDVSTRDGYIEFQSSKNNGEPNLFNMKVDLKKGVFDIGWDTDVGIQIDSNTRIITMTGAGVKIPDGWLYVDRVATVKGDIIGKSNCNITKEVTCLKGSAKVSWEAPLVKCANLQATGMSGGSLKAGSIQGGTMRGGTIFGGSVYSSGRPVKTH